MKTLLGGSEPSLIMSGDQKTSCPSNSNAGMSKRCGCSPRVLLKENYLSEFSTKSERRKVLENLGIDSSIDWGEIGGYIETQKDLMEWLERYIQEGDEEQLKRIPYSNDAYPTVKTLYDAVQTALYKNPEIEAEVFPKYGTKGYPIDKCTITWTYNKPNITHQYLDGKEVDADLREVDISNLRNDTSWIIRGSDGTKETETCVSIHFYYGVMCGVGEILEESYEEQMIVESTDLESEFSVDAGKNKYIWVLISPEYSDPAITVGGISGGFTQVDTVEYCNREFNVWRSDNPGLGRTTIKIS